MDYCTEAKMFDEKVDICTCKAMSELKAGIPSDKMAKTRHEVCTMSTVNIINNKL